MSNAELAVFIVDDDDAMRDALQVLLRSIGMKAYGIRRRRGVPGELCLRAGRVPATRRTHAGDGQPEASGEACGQADDIPIIFLTGHGDIPMAVSAVQAGAVDFIAKPFREQALLDAVKRALERDVEQRRRRPNRITVETRLATLTSRERKVLALAVAGKDNKEIATKLGLGHKTVEFH